MNRLVIATFFTMFWLNSCMNEPVIQPNTNKGNFEALWKIIDTRYCYLDFKLINWDSIHTVYSARVDTLNKQTDKYGFVFFELMGNMLAQLKDGHVNLYSDFNRSRYWKWFTDFPPNFNSQLIFSNRYLGGNYLSVNGLRYAKIDNGRIGYIYYESFADGFSDLNMAYIMSYFTGCKGLIIDVRDNGGGSLEYSEQFASYFFDKETVTGYIRHKTGDGHSDFSAPVEIKTSANKNVKLQQLPVAVLTNRMSYSATNDFVNRMKQAPHAIVVGDRTGGGGGMPFSSEIPNGWMVRFSASPMFDSNMQSTEWGIEPDYKVNLDANDEANGIDTIIETAINLLKQ